MNLEGMPIIVSEIGMLESHLDAPPSASCRYTICRILAAYMAIGGFGASSLILRRQSCTSGGSSIVPLEMKIPL